MPSDLAKQTCDDFALNLFIANLGIENENKLIEKAKQEAKNRGKKPR